MHEQILCANYTLQIKNKQPICLENRAKRLQQLTLCRILWIFFATTTLLFVVLRFAEGAISL